MKPLMRLAAWSVGVAAVAVAVLASTVGYRASAATGDALRQFDAAVPACGVGTGLAFDGTRLYLSCWGSNVLERVSPADGSSLGPITITGATDLNAMAYDGGRNGIWACQGGSSVLFIDLSANSASPAFASNGCLDGLAYDGTDDTIWASCDACSTIYHYSITGAVLGSFPVGSLLGGQGNSGIAVGGDTIYLANNGGQQIYQCDKAITACTLMSTFPRRIEDLECDDVTFPGKGAIWSQDAYDRTLNAWEIPAGTCGIGGGAAGAATPIAETPESDCLPGVPGLPCGGQSGGGNPGNAQPNNAPTTVPSTPLPPTQAPPVAPPPATPAPSGGRAGVITAPDTGTGDATTAGSPLAWFLAAAAMVATGSGAVLAGRRIRRR